MTFKNRVRNIVGDCFNQLIIHDECLQAPNRIVSSQGAAYGQFVCSSALCRIISGWFGTRETFAKLMSCAITQAMYDANTHVWPSSWTTKWRVSNPTNYAIKYKLYKMTIKCDDSGGTPGVWDGGIPFQTGSANMAASGDDGNAPYADYWAFFGQAPRDVASSMISVSNDAYMTTNVTTHRAPVGAVWNVQVNGAGFDWESPSFTGTGGNVPVDFGYYFRQPLSYVFPRLRKKLSVRCVSSKRLLPFASTSFTVKNRVVKEIIPHSWTNNQTLNFIGKVSHFYFLRAVSSKTAAMRNGVGAGGQSAGALGPAGSELPIYLDPFYPRPAQLILSKVDTIKFRTAGDGNANYMRCQAGNGPPTPASVSGNGVFISNEGLIETGYSGLPNFEDSIVPGPAQHFVCMPDGINRAPPIS